MLLRLAELVLFSRHDSWHREAESPCCRRLFRPTGGITRGIGATAPDPAGSKLSPIRRPAHHIRHSQLLERRLESSLRRGGRGGVAAISCRSGNGRFLPGSVLDRDRLFLLSLGSE